MPRNARRLAVAPSTTASRRTLRADVPPLHCHFDVDYVQVTMKPEAYVDRHRFVIEYARGKKVLDCGVIGETELDSTTRVEAVPRGLHWQIRQVADAVGTDYSAELVAEVSAAYPELRLIAADMETIELEEEFDLVIMGDLIEHLSNPGRALGRVRTLLRPNGELLISCPNALGLPNYLRFLVGRFHEGGDHVLSFNQWTLANLLGRHGFAVRRILTCLDRPTYGRQRLMQRAFAPMLRATPRLGGTLLVIAVPE